MFGGRGTSAFAQVVFYRASCRHAGYFTTFYVAKLRRTVNAPSTALLFAAYPTGSLPQIFRENRGIPDGYAQIPCLHSLSVYAFVSAM